MKIPLSVFLEYSPLRCFTIIMPMPALMETAAKTNAKVDAMVEARNFMASAGQRELEAAAERLGALIDQELVRLMNDKH